MEEEKTKEIDFDSFAESAVELDSEDLQTSSEDNRLRGFAELKSCRVSEFTEQINGINLEDRYVIFEAVIHGCKSGLVYVKEDSDLYDFMLEITNSESLSQLPGQYIPVDKVEDGMYQPSKSLLTDFQLLRWDRTDPYENVDRGIGFEYIDYNTETQRWKLINPEGYSMLSDRIGTSIAIGGMSAIISALLLMYLVSSIALFSTALFILSITFSYITYRKFNEALDYLSKKETPL